MQRLLSALIAAVSLFALPAAAGCDEQHPPDAGELVYAAGQLSFIADGITVWERDTPTARPYKIVTDGQPPLVVTMDGLNPTTWAASIQPVAYAGMLPQFVAAPLMVLEELSPRAIYLLPHTVLIGADGTVLWDSAAAALLTPVLCSDATICNTTAYFAEAFDGDAMYPFADSPQLSAVDTSSGKARWQVALPAQQSVADLQLLAQDASRLLLFLQYDYELGEFMLLDSSNGAVLATHPLEGQIAVNLVYPGPAEQLAQLSLSAGVFEVLLILSEGGFATWRIDLASGELTSVATEAPATRVAEQNPNPVGGNGPPGPGHAAFPQLLLPEQSGGAWRIPALIDNAGHVLVIDGDMAQWI